MFRYREFYLSCFLLAVLQMQRSHPGCLPASNPTIFGSISSSCIPSRNHQPTHHTQPYPRNQSTRPWLALFYHCPPHPPYLCSVVCDELFRDWPLQTKACISHSLPTPACLCTPLQNFTAGLLCNCSLPINSKHLDSEEQRALLKLLSRDVATFPHRLRIFLFPIPRSLVFLFLVPKIISLLSAHWAQLH